jgi:hypothetical protein
MTFPKIVHLWSLQIGLNHAQCIFPEKQTAIAEKGGEMAFVDTDLTLSTKLSNPIRHQSAFKRMKAMRKKFPSR